LTGPEIAYLYPDLRTALVGRYEDGELVEARPATLSAVTWDNSVLVPHFTFTSNQ